MTLEETCQENTEGREEANGLQSAAGHYMRKKGNHGTFLTSMMSQQFHAWVQMKPTEFPEAVKAMQVVDHHDSNAMNHSQL